MTILKSEILLVVCCLKNLRFFPEKYEIFVKDFRLIYAATFCYFNEALWCVFSHASVPLYRALLFALVQGMAVCPCAGHGCLIQLLFFRASLSLRHWALHKCHHSTKSTAQVLLQKALHTCHHRARRALHKCLHRRHCTSVWTKQHLQKHTLMAKLLC